tara:strand:+ start:320 stop:1768 length:1449 start_codon:yes stop_codon:yes gene_type:complete
MALGLANNLSKSKGRRAFTSKMAMNFDGSNDYIKILDHADFNHVADGVSKFTVSFWFKSDTTDFSSESKALFSKYDGAANKREWNVRINTSGVILVYVSDNGTNAILNTTSYTVSDTNWHHFVMRYDGSQSATDRCLAYVDGGIVLSDSVGTASSSNPAAINEDDTNITIGAWLNSGSSASEFNGSIDEVAYWNNIEVLAKGGSYIYNNGNPRDLSYTETENLIGYWRLGEYATAGCTVPSGTFPNSTTNPQDSSKYGGSCAPAFVALNWAGGKPRKVGDNLMTNGNFADGGPALAVDETDETVNGWRALAGTAGAVVTTDTSIYRSEGKAAKLTTDADGGSLSLIKTSNAALEDGEFYVCEYWIYTPTDVSDSGSQEWGRTQSELDEVYEGDAQYGLSGDGSIVSSYLKLNQWHRHTLVGKFNRGSDAAKHINIQRQFGNLDAGEGPQIFYVDDLSLYKLSGTHHAFVQHSNTTTLTEGAD